jgi:hypothetical protein
MQKSCPFLSSSVPLCHFSDFARFILSQFFKEHKLARNPQPSEPTFCTPNSSPRRSHAQTGALRTHYTPHLYHLFPPCHVPGEYNRLFFCRRQREDSDTIGCWMLLAGRASAVPPYLGLWILGLRRYSRAREYNRTRPCNGVPDQMPILFTPRY